jgi:hypothetical protein
VPSNHRANVGHADADDQDAEHRAPAASQADHGVGPGARLVDRYCLEKLLGEDGGTSYWRAQDELLDRPVGITLLASDDPHAEQVIAAARKAAAITDPRFLRVLDASRVDGVVYVVNEWVRATSLVELLADDPMRPDEARELAVDISEALAAAHDLGLSHLCLTPEHVLRTTHGQLKLVGLAVEAAARGVTAADPSAAARRDTAGAAEIAYAAVTARWPGSTATALPPAPRDGSAVCSPRQVRAGVPHELDQLLCQALGLPGADGEPWRSPGELAEALADTQLTSRLPVVRSAPVPPPVDRTAAAPSADEPVESRRVSRATVLVWGAVVLVLLIGIALAGGQLIASSLGGDDADAGTPEPSQSASEKAKPAGSKVPVQAVRAFDPQGDGEENDEELGRVVDGDPSTVWITNYYNDPFGPSGLKDGVGILLDLGSPQRVGSVSVRTEEGATSLELRAADEIGAEVDDFPLVADPKRNVVGLARFRPRDELTTRYLLVWLTALPTDGSVYRGHIAEVTVRH